MAKNPQRRFDRALRWLNIPHVTQFLIGGQVLTYLFAATSPAGEAGLERLELVMSKVLQGEVWRLITFPFIPGDTNPLFLLIALLFFYFIGSALEAHWGAAKYNLYLLVGYLFAIVAAWIIPHDVASPLGIASSVFLAFAYLFPEFVIYLFFILPVKVKWLAVATLLVNGLLLLSGPNMVRVLVVASLANYLLFFGADMIGRVRRTLRHADRQTQKAAEEELPFHVCTVCGITDKTHRDMDFRYCPECKGSPCYCADHIRNHSHIA